MSNSGVVLDDETLLSVSQEARLDAIVQDYVPEVSRIEPSTSQTSSVASVDSRSMSDLLTSVSFK